MNVLVSKTPIPSDKIGSWNVLLTSLVEKKPIFFDHIICDEPFKEIHKVNIKTINSFFDLFISKKISFYKKKKFWRPLKNLLLNHNKKINVIVFDDLNLVLAIDYFAKKNKLREKISLNFFLRGYNLDLNVSNRANIYNKIDKLVVQTISSYRNQVQNNHTLPFEVFILRNGVDNSVFFPISINEKEKLREEMNFEKNKKYFLWVSRDRPKKGLFIILKAWKKILENYNNIELLIIGTEKEEKQKGVQYLGTKTNKELSYYYKISDFFLFSSLCHEGHSLSLTEALKSGLICLASNIDPNSEILQNGKLGYLVDDPHFTNSWIKSINYAIENEDKMKNKKDVLKKVYNLDDWISELKKIISI